MLWKCFRFKIDLFKKMRYHSNTKLCTACQCCQTRVSYEPDWCGSLEMSLVHQANAYTDKRTTSTTTIGFNEAVIDVYFGSTLLHRMWWIHSLLRTSQTTINICIEWLHVSFFSWPQKNKTHFIFTFKICFIHRQIAARRSWKYI